MLSLGGERLKFWINPTPRSDYVTAIMVFLAHLRIFEYPDDHCSGSINVYFKTPVEN